MLEGWRVEGYATVIDVRREETSSLREPESFEKKSGKGGLLSPQRKPSPSRRSQVHEGS